MSILHIQHAYSVWSDAPRTVPGKVYRTLLTVRSCKSGSVSIRCGGVVTHPVSYPTMQIDLVTARDDSGVALMAVGDFEGEVGDWGAAEAEKDPVCRNHD